MKISRKSTVDWEKDIYALGAQFNRWPYSPLVSAVMRLTRNQKPSDISVLELGCGTGNNIWFLAEEGFRSAGIDFSSTAIEYARTRFEKLGISCDLKAGDISTLPWPDNSFDIVLDRGALTQNTYEQIRIILAETQRVLRPTGTFMAFTLKGLDHPDLKYGQLVSENTYDHFSQGVFRKVGLTSFFDPSSITQLLSNFGNIRIQKQTIADDQGKLKDSEYRVTAECRADVTT